MNRRDYESDGFKEFVIATAIRMKQRRLELGFTAGRVATLANFKSGNMINNFEGGRKIPSLWQLHRLAGALQCQVGDLTRNPDQTQSLSSTGAF